MARHPLIMNCPALVPKGIPDTTKGNGKTGSPMGLKTGMLLF